MKKRRALIIFLLAYAIIFFAIGLTGCAKNTHVHSFGEWEVICDATCNNNGEKQRICLECGETETETIYATNHSDVLDELEHFNEEDSYI